MLRRGSRRPASSSRRFTPLRHGASTGGRKTVRARGRSSKSSRRSSRPGTRTCTASGRAGATDSWRSGIPGSRAWTTPPLWDEALARIRPSPDEIPEYRRVDAQLADPAERPTDDEYDRYVYLVGLFRELDYLPDRIREATPFALQAALFNSLLVQSNRDLAEIARLLGDDPEPFESWAAQTAAGVDAKLWDEEAAVYVDYDVAAGRRVGVRTAAGLAPLHAGIPSDERARRMIAVLAGSRVEVDDAQGWAVTSLAPDDPGFMPTRYWRGPIWPILNWALQSGLDRYGYRDLAAQVRRALIDLSSGSGFWEHYSPLTGRGQGGEQFAWTAGLVLEVLATELERGKEGTPVNGGQTDTSASASTSNERRE